MYQRPRPPSWLQILRAARNDAVAAVNDKDAGNEVDDSDEEEVTSWDFTTTDDRRDFFAFALQKHIPKQGKPTRAMHWRNFFNDGKEKKGFMTTFNILFTFAYHLEELDTIPKEYERSDEHPIGALLTAAQAVEHQFRLWQSGDYQKPTTKQYFSAENYDDIKIRDPKVGGTKIKSERRATLFFKTVEGWLFWAVPPLSVDNTLI